MPIDVTIFAGTRPEAIKLAPVLAALRHAGVATRLVASGQHGALMHNALATFGLKADADAGSMPPGQTLGALTATLVTRLESDLAAHPPRLVLVQGDTTTAYAGALAAYYRHLPCGHIEAGLRSHDRYAPWPEELNRAMVDRLATRLYAPTQGARENLLREGLADASILVSGQTGVDAALQVAATLPPDPPPELAVALADCRQRLVFATGHRRENQNGGIARVAAVLREMAASRDDVTVLFAAHPSPEVRRELQGISPHAHWRVIEPVSYAASLWLLRHSACVVSDSGGLQEEAPCFGTPVLVTRDNTERPEGIPPGFLHITGTDPDRLRSGLQQALQGQGMKQRLQGLPNPYGDGKASQRIAADVVRMLAGGGH